jgi:hypothetical protein
MILAGWNGRVRDRADAKNVIFISNLSKLLANSASPMIL